MLTSSSKAYNIYFAKRDMSAKRKISKHVERSKKSHAPKMNLQHCLYPGDNKNQDMMLASFPDIVYHMNYSDMSFDYISPNVEEVLGYNVQEMMESGLAPLMLESRIVSNTIRTVELAVDLEMERKNMHNAGRWQADYMLQAKDGRQVWVSDVAHVWRDNEGQVIGAIGCLRDITDRVTLESNIKAELMKLVNTDPLTNLSNRRYFFEYIDLELKRLKRTPRDFSVMILDVDYFKKINDTYGHYTGDQVLIQVSERIKSCLRDSDLVARIGGEEFGVFLPDTPLQGAHKVAERIRHTICDSTFSVCGSPISCSVSIGVASSSVYEGSGSDNIELYKIADQNLYIAKSAGRNQVIAQILQDEYIAC
jgi:diguanylate cyclase (GGDEF)-like protein/PAS domain S-box-containing protein